MDEIFTEPLGDYTEDKTVSIEVLNAAGIGGIAGAQKERLETDGYTVETIGNATLEDNSKTIIYAKNTELATQFKVYYPRAVIIENQSIDYDIQINLGTDIQ